MSNYIGFVGSFCFVVSAIVLAADAIHTQKVGTPWVTIGLICFGAAFSATHAYYIKDLPFFLNTLTTFVCWSIAGGIKLVRSNS